MRSGMLVPTLFGIIGFVAFGAWGAIQCSIDWIGHASVLCGGVFILLATVGYFAGILIYKILKVMARVITHDKR
ncbi:MAG: hypothetical protein HQ475_03255 [SAR202 cluster bacterium]|nr:hypothetical protein [SAR202 cluster bacterium]